LKAGLCGAYVTVDDTGRAMPARTAYTTQIGSSNFTTFAPSLQIALGVSVAVRGGASLYVINDAALAYMGERNLPRSSSASSRST